MQKSVTKPQILVVGASGQQGGSLANRLAKAKIPFRALSRSSQKLKHLKDENCEIIEGTLKEKDSLKKALEGMKQAFLVTTPFEEGMVAEVEQGIHFIDAAKEAGIEHLVFTSVAAADKDTGIPHFETKAQIEKYIQKAGIPATILRPVFFMENFGSLWFFPDIQKGTLYLPMSIHAKLQMISLPDIAKFAHMAFENPKRFIGKTIELAADELKMPHIANKIFGQTHKPLAYKEMSLEKSEERFGHDFTVMFQWFNKVGYSVDIEHLKKEYEIELTNFDTYLENAEWVHTL